MTMPPLHSDHYEIRPMHLCDLDEVMEIERLSFRAAWPRQMFIEELDRDFAFVDVIVERKPKRSRVVAFCNYWHICDEIHILNVATHPKHRQRGHGARLVKHILNFARQNTCKFITLEVRPTNTAACALYRKFGFRPVAIRPNYYTEDSEDALVMEFELT